MKKLLLLTALSGLLVVPGFAQTSNYWSANNASRSRIVADKATTRQSFPKEVKLFTLNAAPLRQALFAAVSTPQSARRSTIISLPNAAGGIENFEVFEASNFEPALQARFPEIRSFSGKGITDKAATLKLSISPQGIQTMVFRTGRDNEFIEPYSQDHTVYAVFVSQRETGNLPWTCTTPDEQLATGLNQQVGGTGRSGGDLKTMRLAQSVNAEYSNYFGATSPSQVGLVLAAINATLTRCNGVYEKDLALHLNLVMASTNVIYYNPSTDPYTTMSNWSNQLQSTLTSVIGEANYDIGHLFGASGGGGNAGCIGCVCVNGSKGRGYTSPADAIPQGDNFDIDYVAHEIGHQLGGNHTFSTGNEGTGVNKEVGSGITIMGYAGITGQDVAPHSIDIFHQASIAQIQTNLAGKTCPVTTTIANATPVVAAVSNYTIPRSTPFALTGSATDANSSDVLTYCWEQNDNAGNTQTNVNSVASPTKLTGPNWLTFPATTSPTRLFPRLATILAGAQVTGPLPGGDAGANIEALSSVGRTLNFRLTVRDNAPYRSTTPVSVGQTSFTDMVVTVSALSGPFVVTAPNTAVTWVGGTSQTITWDVANTTAAPVNCANVKISLSTDGGQTFPTVLAASTPNDGTQVLTIPNTPSNTARIKVEAVDNIFFDISNTNFTITAASFPNLTINDVTQAEGNSSTSAFTFTVSLSAPAPAGGVTFNVATANGTATAGNDYTATTANGSIAAGSSTYSFTVSVNGDVTVEPNETFSVNITNATNAVITDGQGIGTITNDDIANPCATDTTAPVITPRNITINLDATGNATIQPADVIVSATDNCILDSSSFTVTPNTFSCSGSAGSANHQAYVANTNTGNQAWAGELGMEFRVNRAGGILVKQLGAFDHQGNGITGTQSGGIRVAIFNKATQSIVAGLETVITGNADQYAGNHRMKNIAPVTLLPGDYVIVSKGYNANELNGNVSFGGVTPVSGDVSSGAISYTGTSLYGNPDSPTFSYPSNVDGGPTNRYLAGTFVYDVPATADTGSANHQAYVASTTTGNQSWAGELGMEFKVNKASGIIVKQLGTFDHQGNGITGTQSGGIRVAIFNKATQTIVAGLETVITGNADSYTGNHRMKNIAPVTLMPGDYVIVSKGYNDNERNGNASIAGVTPIPGDVSNGAISYTGISLYGNPNSAGFSYPSNVDGGPANRYLAGTFVYDVPGTGTTGGVGDNQVLISVKDAAGNIGYATATVTVTDVNGVCNQPSASIAAKSAVTPVLASAAVMHVQEMKVYPNPSTGVFTVAIANIQDTEATLQVMYENGKVVEQKRVPLSNKSFSQTVTFNLVNQPAGLYFVKLVSKQSVQTAKVIIQR